MTETEFLVDSLNYYIENTERRCVSQETRMCHYDPKSANKESISEGCLIGRHMTPEQKFKADEFSKAMEYGAVVDVLPRNLIPESLSEFSLNFLATLQQIHDSDFFWESNALSQGGKERVNEVIIAFELDRTKFTKGVHYI